MRILDVSSRLTSDRRAALSRLVVPEGEPLFGDLDDLRSAGGRAVLLDGPGPWPGHGVEALRSRAERGTPVVGVGSGVFGGGNVAPLPTGEVFATVVYPDSALARPVGAQFPVIDTFQPLTPGPDLSPVLAVSYRYADRGAPLPRRCGVGRITVSGLGNTAGALASPALAAMLRRALRPSLPAVDGPALGVGVVGYGRFGGMGYLHGTATAATDGLHVRGRLRQGQGAPEGGRARPSRDPGVGHGRGTGLRRRGRPGRGGPPSGVARDPGHGAAAGGQARGLREAAVLHVGRGRRPGSRGRFRRAGAHRRPEPQVGPRLPRRSTGGRRRTAGPAVVAGEAEARRPPEDSVALLGLLDDLRAAVR